MGDNAMMYLVKKLLKWRTKIMARKLKFFEFCPFELYPDEQWEFIENYEHIYAISTYGRVWSLSRKTRIGGKTGIVITSDLLLKSHLDKKGYQRVYLNDKNGKTHFVPIHRLVALAFIENPENKPQVNHIDGNKQNNHISNLEWCTNSENQLHAYKLGLQNHSECSGRPKIAVIQKTLNGEYVAEYNSISEASKCTGIPGPNIRKVLIGERTHTKEYIWERKVGDVQ